MAHNKPKRRPRRLTVTRSLKRLTTGFTQPRGLKTMLIDVRKLKAAAIAGAAAPPTPDGARYSYSAVYHAIRHLEA